MNFLRMTMTLLLTLVSLTFVSRTSWASNHFTCKAKIFNGGDVKVLLTGKALTNEKIEDLGLKLDGLDAFEPLSISSDKNYGISRDRFNRFVVPPKALYRPVVDTYLAILLPKTIGTSRSFTAYLTLRPDGIKRNNMVSCEFND